MKWTLKLICMIYVGLWTVIILAWKIFAQSSPQTSQILLSPSLTHIFGTDALGRDLLARILEGGFVSLSVSFTSSLLSLFVACLVGILWTWYRPKNFLIL